MQRSCENFMISRQILCQIYVFYDVLFDIRIYDKFYKSQNLSQRESKWYENISSIYQHRQRIQIGNLFFVLLKCPKMESLKVK